MLLLKDKLNIPLVIIGNGKKEKEAAKAFMLNNGLQHQLILLNEMPVAKEAAFTTAEDFPAIYQQALALIYPSIFEGFGAPLLEAMCSGIPVISSDTSSLPEVAGAAALYFSPDDAGMLAKHMLTIASDKTIANMLIKKGYEQAEIFSTKNYADSIMNVYKTLI